MEKYGVTVFYTAPTAIRAFMKWREKYLKKHDLSTIRLLGTVGEPINSEAWMMNVEGHRISTMEVESALVDYPSVAEAAVIGKADELKGQAISAKREI